MRPPRALRLDTLFVGDNRSGLRRVEKTDNSPHYCVVYALHLGAETAPTRLTLAARAIRAGRSRDNTARTVCKRIGGSSGFSSRASAPPRPARSPWPSSPDQMVTRILGGTFPR